MAGGWGGVCSETSGPFTVNKVTKRYSLYEKSYKTNRTEERIKCSMVGASFRIYIYTAVQGVISFFDRTRVFNLADCDRNFVWKILWFAMLKWEPWGVTVVSEG